jgi:hypothetical protein
MHDKSHGAAGLFMIEQAIADAPGFSARRIVSGFTLRSLSSALP